MLGKQEDRNADEGMERFSRAGDDLASSGPLCDEMEPLFEAAQEETLDAATMSAVLAHISTCPRCGSRFEQRLAGVYTLARMAPTLAPPPAIQRRLYARINAARRPISTPIHTIRKAIRLMRDMQEPVTSTEQAPAASAQPAHHLGVWFGAVAAVLVVGLLGTVLFSLARLRGAAPGGTPVGCAANAITTASLAGVYLMDLAMTSDTEGWAVGANLDGNGTGVIFHYQQCHWTALPETYPNAGLGSISMISPTEGWAAGGQGNGPLLLHYQGGGWSRVTPPDSGQAPGGVSRSYRVSALATGDVWLVESTQVDQQGNSVVNTLLHLSAGAWTRITTPYQNVVDLASVGRDDIWLIGDMWSTKGVSQALAHYRAGALVGETPITQGGAYISHLRMFAPSDGWATGSARETRNGFTVSRPVALRYDGARWTEAETSAPQEAYDLLILAPGEAWSYTTESAPAPGEASSAPGSIVATKPKLAGSTLGGALSSTVGMSPSSGPHTHVLATQRLHAGHWQTIPLPRTDLESFDLSHIACVTPDKCWAIGGYMIGKKKSNDPNARYSETFGTLLLHYANGAWSQYGQV